MQIGIDSFASAVTDHGTGLRVSPVDRMRNLLAEVETADRAGLDIFGVGEHHREGFYEDEPR